VLPAVLCARWKPFGSDELFTFEIARLPGFGDVWRALRAGADFHPPLDFLLRHASLKAFGESELAFRLPSIAAMWMALGCLFAFVARRTSALYGLIAALIPLSTPVFEYAYEGRGYAWMVALSAAALAAWQRRTEGSRWAAALLALSLAALVWTHYYGVLAFLPIAVGELVRTRERRRIDWGVWAAMAGGSLALFALLPFIRTARQLGAAYWSKVGILQAVSIYETLMERLSIPAAILLGVLLATGLLRRGRGRERRAKMHEIAAVVGFLALPLVAYVLAKAATGALVPRYVFATAVGITAGLAFAAWEGIGASAGAGVLVAAVLGLNAVSGEAAFAWKQRQLRAELDRDNLPELVAGTEGPIVVTDNDALMQLWHYEPAGVARRLVFVADPKAALEVQGYNTIELLFPRLMPWSERVKVEPYGQFMQDHREFLLIDTLRGYVAKNLMAAGARITAKAAYGTKWIFHVEQDAR
jgi:hypothetical protein